MRKFLSTSALAFAAVSAFTTQASADLTFTGGDLSYNYMDGVVGSSYSRVQGSAEFSFGQSFVQIDGTIAGPDGSFGDLAAVGVHFGMNVGENSSVAVFYSYDNFDGFEVESKGVEAKTVINKLELGAAFNQIAPVSGGSPIEFITVDGTYNFNENWGLVGEIGRGNLDGDYVNLGKIGVKYTAENGLYVAAYQNFASDMYGSASATSISVGMNFGGGAKFDARGYSRAIEKFSFLF